MQYIVLSKCIFLVILSDFSYKIFNYDIFLKNFCAKFADYEKKLYLCRNKKACSERSFAPMAASASHFLR